MDKVKRVGCRKSPARVKDVDKYKQKGVLKVNEGGECKVEE